MVCGDPTLKTSLSLLVGVVKMVKQFECVLLTVFHIAS